MRRYESITLRLKWWRTDVDDNTAFAIILSTLFIVIGLVVAVALLSVRPRRAKRGSVPLSVDEQAAYLHSLAEALKATQGPDEQAASRVLLAHAHLLRPGAKDCGCPRPIGPVSSRNIITEADV
jgi:hypothetical protein